MQANRAYVEHVAIRVRDIDWHIRFFAEVLGMAVKQRSADGDTPFQAWTVGGLQLRSDPDCDGPQGRLAHLGIMTENMEAAIAGALARGARQLPHGRNWLLLPDGLELELMQAADGAVAAALAIEPRA